MKEFLVIGGGNMGYAIASGIITTKCFKKQDISFIEKDPKKTRFLKLNGFNVYNNLEQSSKDENYRIVLLAVKPKDIQEVCKKLKKTIRKNTLVVSIAAGVKIKKLSLGLNPTTPITRIMPNIPCQIGEGMSVIATNKYVSTDQKKIIRKIFNSIGKTSVMDEKYFDLVTALSGSGPAYFCYLIEALISAGIKFGINNAVSNELVLQTALGTILQLQKQKLHPKTLRERVTSPKGTTEAALTTLDKNNFHSIIYMAIKSATNRAKELSKI